MKTYVIGHQDKSTVVEKHLTLIGANSTLSGFRMEFLVNFPEDSIKDENILLSCSTEEGDFSVVITNIVVDSAVREMFYGRAFAQDAEGFKMVTTSFSGELRSADMASENVLSKLLSKKGHVKIAFPIRDGKLHLEVE